MSEHMDAETMRYQILYTRGDASKPGDICACEYVTAQTYMDAWCKGTALAVGHERVADVIPLNQPKDQLGYD